MFKENSYAVDLGSPARERRLRVQVAPQVSIPPQTVYCACQCAARQESWCRCVGARTALAAASGLYPRSPRGIGALQAASDGPAERLIWPNLPGAGKELSGLATLFELKVGDSLFSGANVSEATVRHLQDEGGSAIDYAVFSTHGYLDQKNPDLSGIVLSQTNVRQSEDGYLRASELSAFNFRSDLVSSRRARPMWAKGCRAREYLACRLRSMPEEMRVPS